MVETAWKYSLFNPVLLITLANFSSTYSFDANCLSWSTLTPVSYKTGTYTVFCVYSIVVFEAPATYTVMSFACDSARVCPLCILVGTYAETVESTYCLEVKSWALLTFTF